MFNVPIKLNTKYFLQFSKYMWSMGFRHSYEPFSNVSFKKEYI